MEKLTPFNENIKINLQKLVGICGYEFTTNLQNFTQKHLTEVNIFQKVLGGSLFETPSTACYIGSYLHCRPFNLARPN